jgi:hypothetical protein
MLTLYEATHGRDEEQACRQDAAAREAQWVVASGMVALVGEDRS